MYPPTGHPGGASGSASLYDYLTTTAAEATARLQPPIRTVNVNNTRREARSASANRRDDADAEYRFELEAMLSEDTESTDDEDEHESQPLISALPPATGRMILGDLRRSLGSGRMSVDHLEPNSSQITRNVLSLRNDQRRVDERISASIVSRSLRGARSGLKDQCGTDSIESRDHTTFEKCSLIEAGSVFEGKQYMNSRQRDRPDSQSDEWMVRLEVQHVDWSQRTIQGTMAAINVPNSSIPTITTLFEGDLLQDLNEGRWKASQLKTDLVYWTRLQPFKGMSTSALDRVLEGDMSEVQKHYLFLRIKEVAFGDQMSKDAGLTIAGFYFVSIRRSTGRWDSLYHDASSSP